MRQVERNLILACDTGTTGCKCTVFDPSGNPVQSAKRAYPTEYPRYNWAQQDPRMIFEAMASCIRELLEQVPPKSICCIGLSGTMQGCIPVKKDGQILYPNIIHSDGRSSRQVEEILNHISFEDFYQMTGTRPDPHNSLPKILWMKEQEPAVYQEAKWFLNLKDYLYGRLTGRWGYTDYSDASLTCAMDISRRAWAEDFLRELQLDPEKMPVILKGHDVQGSITQEAAGITGLLCGTPVAIGGGDGACATRGAGVHEPGDAYCYIGSSAWTVQLRSTPLLDPKARTYNLIDMSGKGYHAAGGLQCGGSALDWGLKNFLSGEETAMEPGKAEQLALQVGPGAEGVLFLPTLMGWRTPYWDPNTRGCLMGFSLYHDRRHIVRALYEGVAFALNACVEVMSECGAPAHTMMLIGGGASSNLWPDILASLFGLPVRVHTHPREATSLGAAITAGVGVGLFSDYKEASAMSTSRSVHEVNPEWQKAYQEIYPIYADIYQHIRPLNDRLAACSGANPA